ncbi:MAG: hypothetical protein HY321_11505 [Armatimonadetes bacterium]|nr:hypothetical protein [Armatimonadota bacterium]
MSSESGALLVSVTLGGEQSLRAEGSRWVFEGALAELRAEEVANGRRFRLELTNTARTRRKLAVRFASGRQLAYVPHLMGIPPVYPLARPMTFAYYGLPSRVGLPLETAAWEAPLVALLNPGSNQPATTIGCVAGHERGVGLAIEPGAVVFTFLDGTEKGRSTREWLVVEGANLVDGVRRYQAAQGLWPERPESGLMWYIVAKSYPAAGSAEARFRADAAEMARLGARCLVIEPFGVGTLHEREFWNPARADEEPVVRFLSDAIRICKERGIRPLIYINPFHYTGSAAGSPYAVARFREWQYRDAGDWERKRVLNERFPADYNWFAGEEPECDADGRIKTSCGWSPSLDPRCPDLRAWALEFIGYMLERYPGLAGGYVDVWPVTVPAFGKCAAPHAHDYGDDEWWNATTDFLWDIRAAVKSFPGKEYRVNDSRAVPPALASADAMVCEDFRQIRMPGECFWQSLRGRITAGSKPTHMFHHRGEFPHDIKAALFLACSPVLRTQYCAFEWHPFDAYPEYVRALREWCWLLQEEGELEEITIGSESRDIERLVYVAGGRRVTADFRAPQAPVVEDGAPRR